MIFAALTGSIMPMVACGHAYVISALLFIAKDAVPFAAPTITFTFGAVISWNA